MDFQIVDSNIDKSCPLIYLWEIQDSMGRVVYRYIGKAEKGASRPLKHYKRNVNNLLGCKPYRKNNPDGFRKVHHRLAEAGTKRETITLSFVCNVAPDQNIYEIERQWAEHYGANISD